MLSNLCYGGSINLLKSLLKVCEIPNPSHENFLDCFHIELLYACSKIVGLVAAQRLSALYPLRKEFCSVASLSLK